MRKSIRLCRGYAHIDGWNVPEGEYDMPIVLDPDLPTRGEMLTGLTYDGYQPTAIVLREWDERALIHEVLHVLLNPHIRPTKADPDCHRVIAHVEVALLLAGWRFEAAAVGAATTKETRPAAAVPTPEKRRLEESLDGYIDNMPTEDEQAALDYGEPPF